MATLQVEKYPTDFLEFREVLLDDFSGHILALDKKLMPLRLIKIENNRPVQYIDLPYSIIDPLLEDIPFETFSVQYECHVQIAYPDYETELIKERYSYVDPSIETEWSKITQSWTIGQVEITYRTYTKTTVKWKKEEMPVPCNHIGIGSSISMGVLKFNFTIPEHLEPRDCITKRKIIALYSLHSDKNKDIQGYTDQAGNSIEAAYSLFYDDLLENNISISTISTGTANFVSMETSWAKIQGGYHFAYNHFHPNGLPFSAYDIFFPLNNYQWIENRSYTLEEKQSHLDRFTNDFIFRIEVGKGKFYVYTIKDINALKQLAALKTPEQYFNEEEQKRRDILERKENKSDQKTVAEKLLLDLFGNAVDIYKGSTDANGVTSLAKISIDPSGSLRITKIDCYDDY